MLGWLPLDLPLEVPGVFGVLSGVKLAPVHGLEDLLDNGGSFVQFKYKSHTEFKFNF